MVNGTGWNFNFDEAKEIHQKLGRLTRTAEKKGLMDAYLEIFEKIDDDKKKGYSPIQIVTDLTTCDEDTAWRMLRLYNKKKQAVADDEYRGNRDDRAAEIDLCNRKIKDE